MNDKFTKQAEQFFQAAQDVKMPESMQAFAEDGLAKSKAAYEMMTSAAKDAGRGMEEVATVAQKGAKALGEKALDTFSRNTEAAFAAAQQMARSKSLPEAAKVQAEFMQTQMAKAGEQTREFYELSSKIARETFETMSAVARKNLEQMKKVG
ncbi:MAG: phasin family protein [Hyphomicrobiaceae bacterium]